MQKGRITVPTEMGLVDETLKVLEKWGADAVRDCDGVAIPNEILNCDAKIYSTYFPSRGDNAWAKQVPDEAIKIFLTTPFIVATSESLTINIMDGYLTEQFTPFYQNYKKYWQVINRTTGKEVSKKDFTYNDKSLTVTVVNCEPYCEYTVNFLANQIWDSTQMYNYITNNWSRDKDIPFNVFCPKTSKYVIDSLKKWIAQHPDTDVVRFTTFFYHFTLVFNNLRKEKFVDWFGYGASVSLEILDTFEKMYGYALTAEDFVDCGYYNSSFRVPSQAYKDYTALVRQVVADNAKILVDAVHKSGKEAMMFLGDNWIGTEPYGDKFKDIGIDAVVGSVGGGATLRMIADIPHVKYTEGRFLPYFFPDTFYEGNDPNIELNENWLSARRAIMRNPVDRIGYGGYLSLALKFPKFVDRVSEICDEFRAIYSRVKGGEGKPYSKLTIAVVNSWGKLRTWQTHMVAHALWYKQIYSYLGVCESLSGMAFDVKFISFDDVINGDIKGIDVILNAGLAGDAFSGGEAWLNPQLTKALRQWIANGGGFIGIGEPSAALKNGHYFQMAEALGIEKELGFTLSTDKYNKTEIGEHFITKDLKLANLGEPVVGIYANNAKILKLNDGNVQIAVNQYGKGRCCYISGLPYSAENSNLLYRAALYVANREHQLNIWYCDNVNCECSYYPSAKEAAVINSSMQKQTTSFYDGNGKKTVVSLEPCEIKWIKA